jgi:hypothetical protein
MKLFTKDIDKKLFAQFPKGGELANQKVIAKIFNPYGRGVWYIINSDPNDPDYLWAIVNLFEVEVGSVSRKELESLRIKPFMLPLERDLSFSERNALEVYKGVQEGERYEDGGEMDDDEGVDLFEDYEDQPKEVSELLSTLDVEDYNYDSLNDLLSKMKKIGYTFDFGLDAEPYDLRKIGQKGKSEFYAEGGETKRKITLYESKLMAEEGKRVLVSQDGQQFYTIEEGVLYKTDDDLNHQEEFDMDKIKLTILPMESYEGKFAKGGKTPLMLEYVSPRDIAILKITTDDGIKHSIKGESIISGEYKLAQGGKLGDNYIYIPKRNIEKVVLKNGETTDDKFNGFYVKKESLKSVESYSSEENDGVAKMKNAIAKVKSIKTLKSKEIANTLELANTFAFQDAVKKAIEENKKSEAIDVYADAINTLTKSNKYLVSQNLAEYGNPNTINLFPAKYVDVPSLKLKSIAKKSNIENDENWLKQISKFAMNDSDSSYFLRPALTSVRFENNSVVATNANILIHIYNETEVEAKEICVSNVCKKIGGDKTSENPSQSKYPQWTYIVINSFDRLDSCEINVNDFLKLAEFSVNHYTSYFNEIPFVAIKTKHRTIFFNSEFIVKTMTTLKLLGLTKCKMYYDSEKKNNAIYFTSVEATYNPLENDFILVMPIISHNDQEFGIDAENGKYIIAKNEYKKGGMTFNEKVESVQLSLLERKVPKKYQNTYGKTYNKEEAHESAKKIIGAQVKKYNKK